ncbi:cholecystokinin receptor-like [Mytilus californianus]|uniref:cholecystokinin receptor-like n=1 Tax=Mytilus californianus TaxID=6549 RepID=UPI00224840E1|nr:cholecystokinin receptor-like [Mytilus californianus]
MSEKKEINMNNNTILNNITLSEWNEEITNSLLPNIIILSVYLALGTCGNVFVLLVYAFQMKKPSDERYFIPVLAFFDMVATIYLGVHYIFQCFNQTTFSNNILCKTLVYFVASTTYTSVFILSIIAIQRYMKVCMPLKPSMSISIKRCALFVAIIISLLLSLTLPFVYGTIPYHSIKYGTLGMRCGRLKEGNAFTSTLYSVGTGTLVFVVVTLLIILYGRILKKVFRSLKIHKNDINGDKKEIEKVDEDDNCRDIGCNDIEMSETKPDSVEQQGIIIRPVANNLESAVSRKRRIINRRITNKLTFMFFIITTVFILSYIPKVIVLCLDGIYKDFWENLSTSQRPAVTFLYHIFIINNIVNPIIYAFMDMEFRDNAAILLKRMFINPCFCIGRIRV